jgi:hypothetical protein
MRVSQGVTCVTARRGWQSRRTVSAEWGTFRYVPAAGAEFGVAPSAASTRAFSGGPGEKAGVGWPETRGRQRRVWRDGGSHASFFLRSDLARFRPSSLDSHARLASEAWSSAPARAWGSTRQDSQRGSGIPSLLAAIRRLATADPMAAAPWYDARQAGHVRTQIGPSWSTTPIGHGVLAIR